MNNSIEVLFKLLKIAISGKSDEITSRVDWMEVQSIALEQNVIAMAFDAIECLPKSQQPDLDALMEWLGQTSFVEQTYELQWTAAKELGDVVSKENIRTFVMKGFSISTLYSHPNHRASCDLDTYCVNENGQCANEEVDKLIEVNGIDVDRSYYKNSKFCFKGLTVENHRHLLPVKGSKKAKNFEARLLDVLMPNTPIYIGDTHLESPSPLFLAVHVLAHAQEHFFEEGINLRHVCDWALCLKLSGDKDGKTFWTDWKRICEEFGLLKFGYALSRLAHNICGVEIPFDYPSDNKADEMLLKDILTVKHSDAKSDSIRRIELFTNIIKDSWKFKYFSDTNAFAFACGRVWGYLFEKD